MSIEETLERDKRLYAESLNAAQQPWATAFRICRRDLAYKSRYCAEYYRRLEPVRLAIAILIAVVLPIPAYFISGRNFAVHTISSIVIFALLLVAYYVRYRRMGIRLFLIRERLEGYCRRWPNILELVRETPEGIIPPEPEDVTAPFAATVNFWREKPAVGQSFDAKLKRAADEMFLAGVFGPKPGQAMQTEARQSTVTEMAQPEDKPEPKDSQSRYDKALMSALEELDSAELELDIMRRKTLTP